MDIWFVQTVKVFDQPAQKCRLVQTFAVCICIRQPLSGLSQKIIKFHDCQWKFHDWKSEYAVYTCIKSAVTHIILRVGWLPDLRNWENDNFSIPLHGLWQLGGQHWGYKHKCSRWIGTPPSFSSTFSKGDNFRDFLIACLENYVFPKWDLLSKERTCS